MCVSKDDHRQEGLYDRLDGLYLAGADMHSALMTARYLQGIHPEAQGHVGGVPTEVRRGLETGMVVTCARPFNNNPPRHLRLVGGLSEDLRSTHDEVLKRRNTVYAHTDRSQLRRIVELADAASRETLLQELWESGFHEEWSEMTVRGLDDIAELAAAHLGLVLEQIEKVRKLILGL